VNIDVSGEFHVEIFTFPFFGELHDMVEIAGYGTLLTSRSLHEICLGYGKDTGRLYDELHKIHNHAKPSIVFHGIVNQHKSLSEEETARFREASKAKIGHSDNPATDYLDFDELLEFMVSKQYYLSEQRQLIQLLPAFDCSPWQFGIGVFGKR
jgi:hypothetical protein